MIPQNKKALKEASPYTVVITREQFLFYEMRTTARLVEEKLTDAEIADRICNENLFQYPTEKSVRQMAFTCIRRLKALDDPVLVSAVAAQPSDVAKQICLYAMMKQYRLVWDFMVTVIGEKYRLRDLSFGKIELNTFFMRLQEQDDWVAAWSEATITKIKQLLTRVLMENEYLDSLTSDHLNPVLIYPILENAIRDKGDDRALAAFNCFS